jgi:assimilatory nitrate reductase electron transfer subunit
VTADAAASPTTTPPLNIVVIGHGMVGARFVDEVVARNTNGQLRITVLGAEPYGPYNRVLLSEVVAGRADVAALTLAAAPASETVHVCTGVTATAVDRRTRTVTTDDSTTFRYDLLVLATGSRPAVPRLNGISGPQTVAGVRTFRTIDDCREIVAATANARAAVVLGGGVLGVEAARGLAARGLEVTLVHAGGHPLDRQLDAGAGFVLAQALRNLGVRLCLGAAATGVEVVDGRCSALLLADGQRLPADLLVLACGVRPDARLVDDLTGPTGGVVVDDRMHATGDPSVAAIGDCAEHRGIAAGLIAPGWAQARVLAELVTRTNPLAQFQPARPVLRLKAAGLDVAAVGDPGDLAADPWTCADGTEVVQFADPSRGAYVKAVLRDDRVVAATIVGAPRTASELLLLVERGTPSPLGRATLLLPHERGATAVTAVDDPTRIPDRATICRCNGVTKGAIVRAFGEGARDIQTLAARTRATTGCGGCTDVCAGLLTWLTDSDAPPATAARRPTEASSASEEQTDGPHLRAAPTGGAR